jgi:ankyrin repeat protein
MSLARPAWLRPNTMTNALTHGNIMLVKHLLRSGYDANTPTLPGFSTLYHALHRGAGIAAIHLLENGADPTCSVPGRPACPLTIIGFAPEGTHTDEVVQRLIDGGNSYEKENSSFMTLYDRAVIDGWESTADLLIKAGLPREPSDRRLFNLLLRQNSDASIQGIKYLLKKVPVEIIRDPRIDSRTGDNILHRLLRVQEDIRNDELSSTILKSLLDVFDDISTLNGRNKGGYTPATMAADLGHYSAVKTLATRGADLTIGAPSPFDVVAARILLPDKFDGDISTASSRGRKKRRYADNTVGLLTSLLRHSHPYDHSWEEDAAIVRREILVWQGSGFLEKASSSGVTAATTSSALRVEVDAGSRLGCMVLETHTGARQLPTEKEIWMITKGIWTAVVEDWNKIMQGKNQSQDD